MSTKINISVGADLGHALTMHLRGPHTVTVVICQLVPREPSTYNFAY